MIWVTNTSMEPMTGPWVDYSVETQVHWSKLVPGTEYLITSLYGTEMQRFTYSHLLTIGTCTFVQGTVSFQAFAVGEWANKPGGPDHRFWSADTPLKTIPKPVTHDLDTRFHMSLDISQ
jgi:hypothetical protein